MKRPATEIASELAALEALIVKLPNARRNLRIVLETLSEGRSVDDVYDTYDSEDPEFQYALDAAMWLSGDSDSMPSDGWE